jgi:hypothetical protein
MTDNRWELAVVVILSAVGFFGAWHLFAHFII